MTDPKRLLDGGDALEARLLASAMDDAPGEGLDRRVHAALGIGAAIGVGTTAATSAAAASKATPYLVSFGVAKWIGVVAIGAGSIVGAQQIHSRLSAPSAPETSNAAVAAPKSPARSRAIDIPPPPPPALTDDSPVAAPPPKSAAKPSVGSWAETTPIAPARSGGAEIALIDRARRALDADDTRLALELLDRRDLDFESGMLAPESLEVRIEVYAHRGDASKVRELGESFLAKYPKHPSVSNVRSLMQASSNAAR